MKKDVLDRYFNIIYTVLFVILIVGTPLVFTSLTRSVFEVSKFLLLRSISFVTGGVWLFQYLLYRANGYDNNKKESYNILGFKWKKIGLEIPTLIWLFINLLSTLFSVNIIVSIFGSYDRWEGLISIINYAFLYYMIAKLVTQKWQIKWCLSGLILSTGISALYGIFQSLNYDFMNWSVDPTKRVFGCINNPVHFCAYMAMVLPVCIGVLLYLSNKKNILLKEYKAPIRPILFGIIFLIPIISKLIVFNAYPEHLILETFTSFLQIGLSNILFLLIGVSAVLCYFSHELIPSRKNILLWVTFFSTLILLNFFNLLPISKESWFIFIITTGIMYSLSPYPNYSSSIKRLLLFTIIYIYYAQLLSFSRATWMGFVGAMTFFYLFIVQNINKKSLNQLFLDSIMILLCICTFYLTMIFKLHLKNVFFLITFFSIIIGALLFFFFSTHPKKKRMNNSLSTITFSLLIICNFLIDTTEINSIAIYFSHFLITAYLIFSMPKTNVDQKRFFGRLFLIILFIKLQFMAISWLAIFLGTSLLILVYQTQLKNNNTISYEKKYWIISTLTLFCIIVTIPALPSLLSQVFQKNQHQSHLKALNNIDFRINSYKKDALQGTARTSMWKSGYKWSKENWLLGTGPDTIRYYYPKYRRPEYGILEGGHNFTPDRLHNEYINTLATRGVFGFLIFYFGFVTTWYYIVIKKFYQSMENPSFSYISLALLIGASIYFGQVMFNFGVVATLILLFILMGLGTAISQNIIKNEQ